MNITAIRAIARHNGLKGYSQLRKADLIRAIQCQEGNFDCYAKASNGYCDQTGCLWRDDCLNMSGANRQT